MDQFSSKQLNKENRQQFQSLVPPTRSRNKIDYYSLSNQNVKKQITNHANSKLNILKKRGSDPQNHTHLAISKANSYSLKSTITRKASRHQSQNKLSKSVAPKKIDQINETQESSDHEPKAQATSDLPMAVGDPVAVDTSLNPAHDNSFGHQRINLRIDTFGNSFSSQLNATLSHPFQPSYGNQGLNGERIGESKKYCIDGADGISPTPSAYQSDMENATPGVDNIGSGLFRKTHLGSTVDYERETPELRQESVEKIVSKQMGVSAKEIIERQMKEMFGGLKR